MPVYCRMASPIADPAELEAKTSLITAQALQFLANYGHILTRFLYAWDPNHEGGWEFFLCELVLKLANTSMYTDTTDMLSMWAHGHRQHADIVITEDNVSMPDGLYEFSVVAPYAIAHVIPVFVENGIAYALSLYPNGIDTKIQLLTLSVTELYKLCMNCKDGSEESRKHFLTLSGVDVQGECYAKFEFTISRYWNAYPVTMERIRTAIVRHHEWYGKIQPYTEWYSPDQCENDYKYLCNVV